LPLTCRIVKERQKISASDGSLSSRKTLLREVDHRAKNILQAISATLSLEARRATSPDVKAALSRVSARLAAMAEVQAMLYHCEGGDGSDGVAMDRYLAGLCEGISRSLRGQDGQIRFDMTCEPFVWPERLAQYVGMLASEILTNSCKHAFPQNHPGIVRVRLVTDDDHAKALLEMSDGGFGYAPDAKHDGLGTQLITTFVQAIAGDLAVISQPHVGTTVRVRFPKPPDQTGPARAAGTSAASSNNPGTE